MELNRFIVESYAGHFGLACCRAPLDAVHHVVQIYVVTLAAPAFLIKIFHSRKRGKQSLS